MNAGSIWWGQIGNSLKLISRISNSLQDCQSAVLHIPENFPWKQQFYDAVDHRRRSFGGERSMIRKQWIPNADPGMFILYDLDDLCSPEIQADYWPGQTPAAYLAGRTDAALHDYYIWITGIHSKQDMAKWAEFTSEFTKTVNDVRRSAVFILEYDGSEAAFQNVPVISYHIEEYDCRVYALEASAELENSSLRSYQAEMALSICQCDPELCYELLLLGDKLLKDTEEAVQSVLSEARSTSGKRFPSMTENQIVSAAWEASIILMFPILERVRLHMIDKYDAALNKCLPITNSYDEKVTEVCDLEINNLAFLSNRSGTFFSPYDADMVRFCRSVRNQIAHNRIIPFKDAQKLFGLTFR